MKNERQKKRKNKKRTNDFAFTLGCLPIIKKLGRDPDPFVRLTSLLIEFIKKSNEHPADFSKIIDRGGNGKTYFV